MSSRKSDKVLAFRVRVNGKLVATAGIPGPHVLSAIVSSVVRDDDAAATGAPKRRFRKRELGLHLGGLVTIGREHVHWANVTLNVGDRVAIQVVEVSKTDIPKRRPKTYVRRVEKART